MSFRVPVIISQLISSPPFPLPSHPHPHSRMHSRPSFATTFKNETKLLSLKGKAWKKISALNSYPHPTPTPSKASEWLVTLPTHLWCPSCFPLLLLIPLVGAHSPRPSSLTQQDEFHCVLQAHNLKCHPAPQPALNLCTHGWHLSWAPTLFDLALSSSVHWNCPLCTSLNEGTLLLSFSLPSSTLYGVWTQWTLDEFLLDCLIESPLTFLMYHQGLRLLALKFLLSCTCTAMPTPVYH